MGDKYNHLSGGKDVVEREPLFTVVGNVIWYSQSLRKNVAQKIPNRRTTI